MIALVVAGVLPVLAFAGLMILRTAGLERGAVERHLTDTAHALSLSVDRKLAEYRAVLVTLSNLPSLRTGDLAALYDLASEAPQPEGAWIMLSDASGRQLVNTRYALGVVLPERAQPEAAALVFKSGGPVISGLFRSPHSSEPVVSVDVPVRRDGQVVYSLAMILPAGALSRTLADQNLPEGWIAAVFDRDGTTIARTHQAQRFVGQPAKADILEAMRREPEGWFANVTREGIPVYNAFSHSALTGWGIAIGVPQQLVDGPLQQSLHLSLAGGVALLLIGIGLAWAAGRRVSTPVQALSRAAVALGQGGEALRYRRSGIRELDEVGSALEEANRELARREAERGRAEQALRESEEKFRAMAEHIPQLAWMANPDGWIFWYNRRWYDYTGTTPEQMAGWGWQSVHDPEMLPSVLERWKESIATGEPFDMVFPLRGADGSFRPFLTRVAPVRDAQGRITRWFGTNTDFSEQKKTEERQRLLLDELNHRVKNTLASVQSIASQTLRSAETPEEFRQSFQSRLHALSHTHDLLTVGHWQAVSLRAIVEHEVAPYAQDAAGRAMFDGPDIRLPARAALALGLAFHELATNAAKYGAFSVETGRVSVKWRLVAASDGLRLHIEWSESGGPPVRPPTRRGFGTRVIERGLAMELGGRAELDYAPAGLICTIDLSYLPDAAARPGTIASSASA